MRRWWLAAAVPALILALVGCGTVTTPNTTTGAQGTAASSKGSSLDPPFRVVTSLEVVTPDAKFDPSAASLSLYQNIPVYTASGKVVHLDARKQPILIEAYWCPHCQRTLLLFNKHSQAMKQRPILISTGFAQGTTLQQAVKLGEAEDAALHLQNYQMYYYIAPNFATRLVPVGFPTLVFPWKGKVGALYGEHTWAAWQPALG